MQAKESIKSILGTENRKLLGGGTLSAPQFSWGAPPLFEKNYIKFLELSGAGKFFAYRSIAIALHQYGEILVVP